jgi:predicted transcriptional regulator
MKTATFPSLRVEPDLRDAAESVLREGETVSSFVEQAIRDSVQRRQMQQEFISRGLRSRDNARKTNDYVSSAKVITRLEKTFAKAKSRGGV